jgi:hypothetical protein
MPLDTSKSLAALAAAPKRGVDLDVAGTASPRMFVRVALASLAVLGAYPRVTSCFSQTLISSGVSESRVRSPNSGRMCASIRYR